mgnify:CR=1 FL=1
MKITYKEFEAYLEKAGYSLREIAHLFNAVKSMDRDSRKWVLRWFDNGALPSIEIEGVTASYLVDECGYKPMNAFIILDWLKTDPQAAKYFILKIPSTVSPSESIGEEIIKYIDDKEIKSSITPVDERDFLND